MVYTRHGSLQVPYDGALRAFAYTGMPFTAASRIIDMLGFLQPLVNNTTLRTHYLAYRHQAHDINPSFKFAKGLADSLGINPLYEWVTHNREEEYPYTRVDTILDEMRRPLLRKSLDILLYVGWSPTEIAEALNNKIDAPVRGWDAEDITIYRDFFWRTDTMGTSDWERYTSWWPAAPMDYQHNYIFRFLDSSKEELLWMAGIVEAVSPQQMAKAMMMECYMRFRKHASAAEPDSGMMMRHMDAFRKLAVASRALDTGDENGQSAANSIMQSINVAFKASDAVEPITRESLDDMPIVVSPREALGLEEHDPNAQARS